MTNVKQYPILYWCWASPLITAHNIQEKQMDKMLEKSNVLAQLLTISDTKLFLQEKEIKLREKLEKLNDKIEDERENINT